MNYDEEPLEESEAHNIYRVVADNSYPENLNNPH